MKWQYIDQNRVGDHICYYSDLRKMKSHFPGWRIEKSLTTIFNEIAQAWTRRIAQGTAR
jgi:CDP-paratose 2-epimerase